MRSIQLAARPQLVEVLFGAYRRRILALLLLRADESFYVREIARLTSIPAGSLHRELKLLADAGLLSRTSSGNQIRYQADRSCSIYPELAGIFRKTAGIVDVLREALAPLSSKISLAFVFGSVAEGKEQAGSDIDLLVVGLVPFAAVVEVSNDYRERLGRDVNPVVMTKAAFQTKIRTRDRFVSRVAKEAKLYVMGDVNEFGKLIENRPT